MNKLKNTICYLAGNLENSDDSESWRVAFTKELEAIGVKVLDPTKPMFHEQLTESQDMRENFKLMRTHHQFDDLHEIMKNIIRRDLRAVDLSTFLVIRLEPSKPTWGTVHEIIQASQQRKPMFFLIDDKANMPMWLIGLVNMDFVFTSKSALLNRIHDFDCGNMPMDNKYWKILLP